MLGFSALADLPLAGIPQHPVDRIIAAVPRCPIVTANITTHATADVATYATANINTQTKAECC